MLQQLFKFKGGVKPATHKAASVQAPIRTAPIPSRLVVPLHQSIGGQPTPARYEVGIDERAAASHQAARFCVLRAGLSFAAWVKRVSPGYWNTTL